MSDQYHALICVCNVYWLNQANSQVTQLLKIYAVICLEAQNELLTAVGHQSAQWSLSNWTIMPLTKCSLPPASAWHKSTPSLWEAGWVAFLSLCWLCSLNTVHTRLIHAITAHQISPFLRFHAVCVSQFLCPLSGWWTVNMIHTSWLLWNVWEWAWVYSMFCVKLLTAGSVRAEVVELSRGITESDSPCVPDAAWVSIPISLCSCDNLLMLVVGIIPHRHTEANLSLDNPSLECNLSLNNLSQIY